MYDVSLPFEIPVAAIGPLAAQCVEIASAGQIIALSKSTFYIRAPDQLLCVGNQDCWRGPLNLVTTARPETEWLASGLQLHLGAHISPTRIVIGNRFIFSLSDCVLWSPETSFVEIDACDVRRGLDAVRRAAARYAPTDGFGRSLVDSSTKRTASLVAGTAEPLIEAAQAWARQTLAQAAPRPPLDRDWVGKMSGLGPGLTPSGDDFLGGMMIALHMLGDTESARCLWQVVRANAECNGNLISLAHLEAASKGLAGELIHQMGAAILIGRCQEVVALCQGINRLGHSSGWDIMAGVGVVLDAWLQAQQQY